MRDTFGEVDPDEVEIIDFIDADPSAFDANGPVTGQAGTEQPASEQLVATRHRRRWLIPTAVIGVAAIAAGAFAWSPWTDDDTTAFPDGGAPELTLTDRLVFDDPPAELTAASLGADGGGSLNDGLQDALGFFFAEPGASWDFTSGQTTGTWAGFVAIAADNENAPSVDEDNGGESADTIQGAPAVVHPVSGGARGITFGPANGLMFDVVTAGMSLAESLAFAESVGIDNGVPVISDGSVMGAMEPLGGISDYSVAIGTGFAAMSPFSEEPGIVSAYYGEFDFNGAGNRAPTYSIATQPVSGSSTLSMLQFVLGGETGQTVHGQPAIVVAEIESGFGLAHVTSSLVAWVESGRLIVVTGADGAEATMALAETVRPATDNEWAHVVEVAQNSFDPSIPLFPAAETVTLHTLVDPETGNTVAVTVEIGDDLLTPCVEEQNNNGSSVSCGAFVTVDMLPIVLTTDDSSGRRFVLALTNCDGCDEAELRIKLADGTIESVALEAFGPQLPGPAVSTLLPDDHGTVELWIGDKLVASL